MKLTRGFTLAEVLITLGIIGVIAALVLPALFNTAPNKEQIMLKKAYYLFSRNVNEMINDEELYPERDDPSLSGFSNISITDQSADGGEAMFHGQRYSGDSKFCELMASRMNIKGAITCNNNTGLANGGSFISADGIVWDIPLTNFDRGNGNNSTVQINIDVNGREGRNCYSNDAACTVPDRFRIIVDRFGRITVPQDGIEQEYLTRTATNKSYAQVRNANN